MKVSNKIKKFTESTLDNKFDVIHQCNKKITQCNNINCKQKIKENLAFHQQCKITKSSLSCYNGECDKCRESVWTCHLLTPVHSKFLNALYDIRFEVAQFIDESDKSTFREFIDLIHEIENVEKNKLYHHMIKNKNNIYYINLYHSKLKKLDLMQTKSIKALKDYLKFATNLKYRIPQNAYKKINKKYIEYVGVYLHVIKLFIYHYDNHHDDKIKNVCELFLDYYGNIKHFESKPDKVINHFMIHGILDNNNNGLIKIIKKLEE